MKTIETKMPFCKSVSRWATLWVLAFGIFLAALAAGFGQSTQPIPLIDPTFDEIPAGLDYSFTPQLRAFSVSSLAVQADGKVLAAGARGVVRLNPDGLLDTSFKPRNDGEVTGPVLVQSDGKILISGPFAQLDGQPRRGVARLNPDGSLDKGFTANDTSSSINVVRPWHWMRAAGFSLAAIVPRLETSGEWRHPPEFEWLESTPALRVRRTFASSRPLSCSRTDGSSLPAALARSTASIGTALLALTRMAPWTSLSIQEQVGDGMELRRRTRWRCNRMGKCCLSEAPLESFLAIRIHSQRHRPAEFGWFRGFRF